jgi:hypothetical protein
MLENKYTTWYLRLVDRARTRQLSGYTEKHHVIPRSLGKSDDVVVLTAREHLICHLLLTKMYEDEAKYKMQWALHRMNQKSNVHHPGRIIGTSRIYEHARKSFIKSLQQPHSEKHKQNIAKALIGHKVSERSINLLVARNKQPKSNETRLRMSLASKGKPKSLEMRQKLSLSRKGRSWIDSNPSIEQTQEWKRKLSKSLLGRPKSDVTRMKMSEAAKARKKA